MINFKKISAIAGTALMVGMTMGVAAAANYPAPFVSGGVSDVAIVYGTGSGVSILDAVEGGSIQSNLQSFMSGGTTGTSVGTVSGEAAALFTGGTKLYLNDALNNVKTVMTKADLPTALQDESFSGNVDATTTQTIQIGPSPRLVYKQQPTSNDDPQYGLNVSTTSTAPMFNMTATFSKAVAFSDTSSKGQNIRLFGMPFTVSSSTDNSSLVLLKSAQKVDLRLDVSSASATSTNSKIDVVISGKTYTVELVSGTSTDSTIKVTDSTGKSETQTVTKATSKKINGITVAVTSSTSAGNVVTSTLVAGSDKVTLTDGSNVLLGESQTVLDGTQVSFNGATPANITKLTIGIRAIDSDHDAILPGSSYVDNAFGAIKINFAGLNVPIGSPLRENISIDTSGTDKVQVTFTENRGKVISTVFAKNSTVSATGFFLGRNDDGNNISVRENRPLHTNDYLVVGNELNGYLLKLQSTANSSTSGTTSDKATFQDVATGDTLDTVWTAEGTGTLNVAGRSYTVTMRGNSDNASADRFVWLDYPDSSTANQEVLFPSIQTQRGAKLMFYHPTSINLTDPSTIDQAGGGTYNAGVGNTNLTGLLVPNGNGFSTITITQPVAGGFQAYTNTTILVNGVAIALNGTGVSATVTVGELNYNITSSSAGNDTISVYLVKPGAGGNMFNPGLILLDEKDQNNNYHANVVVLENNTNVGVSTIIDTWSNTTTVGTTWKSNNKLSSKADLWGVVTSVDITTADQYSAKISYPDEEVNAQLYIGAASSSVTGGVTSVGGSTQLGDVLIKDSEVSSVSATKNLVVVGGSCINAVASTLLGGAKCGSDFTSKTGVGSGQFLIQSFGDAFSVGNIALLVAGYDVSDTVNAARYLRTQAVKTDASTKYIGTTSTSATLSTATTTGNVTK